MFYNVIQNRNIKRESWTKLCDSVESANDMSRL